MHVWSFEEAAMKFAQVRVATKEEETLVGSCTAEISQPTYYICLKTLTCIKDEVMPEEVSG